MGRPTHGEAPGPRGRFVDRVQGGSHRAHRIGVGVGAGHSARVAGVGFGCGHVEGSRPFIRGDGGCIVAVDWGMDGPDWGSGWVDPRRRDIGHVVFFFSILN